MLGAIDLSALLASGGFMGFMVFLGIMDGRL
jgi:hypothetical protein